METQTLRTGLRGLRRFGTYARTLALALGILLLGLPVFSQSSTGRILGDVRDQSDALIVGATVEITDVQRGVSRTLETDGAGEYVAPNLEPIGLPLRRAASSDSNAPTFNWKCPATRGLTWCCSPAMPRKRWL